MLAVLRVAARSRDVALAAAVGGLGYAELLTHATYQGQPVWPGPVALNAAFIAGFTVPLAFRRRNPLASCLGVLAVLSVGAGVLGGGQATAGFVAGLVAVFSGALHAERPAVVAAASVAALAVIDLAIPDNRNLNSVLWGLGVFGVAWLFGRAVHGRQRTIGTLEREAAERERRHREQIAAQRRAHDEAVAAATSAERAAIARELHDIVAHAVSLIVIQSQAGHRALPAHPAVAAQALATIERSGRSALGELRRLLTLLDPDEPAGVSPAPTLRHLDDLLESCRAGGLEVALERRGVVPPLEPAAELAAYRVVQEALTNTLRHAPGAAAQVHLDADAEGIRLVVRDDGGRAPAPPRSDGAARGLIGMRERLSLCGGALVTAGPTGSGFRIEARLPAARDRSQPVPPGALRAAVVADGVA